MSGISYKARLEDAAARAQLQSLIDRMENREGFLKNVGEHLLNSVRDNFESESGPDGEKWQPLSPVTIALRERRGIGRAPILRVSGRLVGSYNYRASNDDVRIGSSLVYAAIQHFGGEAGHGRKGKIPARPHLGISSADQEIILKIAEEWITSAI
ncbi:phage virion morphogenesis protein [Ensifer sp. NBAIM29]|nr:phage virion morphogenesis protein [Ensifer sp. NBAIM29]